MDKGALPVVRNGAVSLAAAIVGAVAYLALASRVWVIFPLLPLAGFVALTLGSAARRDRAGPPWAAVVGIVFGLLELGASLIWLGIFLGVL